LARLVFSFKQMGPGLILAGAAVGVSHLVQSTRAGASYGLELLPMILLANILKFPSFYAAPLYVDRYKNDLIHAYEHISKWLLALVVVTLVSTMFIVIAAVCLMSGGLLGAITGLPLPASLLSAMVMALVVYILIKGHYQLLDQIMKPVYITLSISLLLCAALLVAKSDFSHINFVPRMEIFREPAIYFVIALMGWMPAPLDMPIYSSMWTLEKHKSTKISSQNTRFDFHAGYWSCTILAILFLFLGYSLMYQKGISFAASPIQFSQQILGLFRQTLGDWAYPLVGTCILLVMFSTSLAVMDGYQRLSLRLIHKYFSKSKKLDTPIILSISLLAYVIILLFSDSMKVMADFATTICFLTTPLFALTNHQILFHKKRRLSTSLTLKIISNANILFFSCMSLYFFYLKLR